MNPVRRLIKMLNIMENFKDTYENLLVEKVLILIF